MKRVIGLFAAMLTFVFCITRAVLPDRHGAGVQRASLAGAIYFG
jgi:hypothetical protein